MVSQLKSAIEEEWADGSPYIPVKTIYFCMQFKANSLYALVHIIISKTSYQLQNLADLL